MDNKIRKKSYDYLLSDVRIFLIKTSKITQERFDNNNSAGAAYRLTAINAIVSLIDEILLSNEPWNYFAKEANYDQKRMTKRTIALLKKHQIIAGVETTKDIQLLNALSKTWGLVDIIAAQLKNRFTRQKCLQLLQSHGTCRWERAAETFMQNTSGRKKIVRCIIYLYNNKLLPGHDRKDIQLFLGFLQRYENINWEKAPAHVLETKYRLTQINNSLRQKKKRERDKINCHEE